MNERAYRRALALAHACGLDWAAWAMGTTVRCPRERDDFYGNTWGYFDGRVAWCRRCDQASTPIPVPARIEDLHAPYLADCERRGVAPGPLPSLEHNADGVAWCVTPHGHWSISVGRDGRGAIAFLEVDFGIWLRSIGCEVTADDLARLSNLVSAVARADAEGP